jgi:transcriptional regulator with XRE-family HTH domain
MVTQVEIARKVGLDVSSVNKILNRRAGPVFRKETIRKVFKVAKDLGYDFGRIKFHHRRRHPRKEVAIGAEIRIVKPDGSVHDTGSATIRDLSLSGAKLADVQLPKGTLPAGPFTVTLRTTGREDIELAGRVVRFQSDVGAYGIQFSRIEGAGLRRLGKLIGG